MNRATLRIALPATFPACVQAAGDSLDDLGLEALAKTDITSVSRKDQSLVELPAADFVISTKDIRHSGTRPLSDVLRMAPGIDVAQIDNERYAVRARGFNGRFANKLQVLINGRSIYNPLLAGASWELDQLPSDAPSKCRYFGGTVQPIMFIETQTVNGLVGWGAGLEFSADWQLIPNWRLQLSYSWSHLEMNDNSNPAINADATMTRGSGTGHYGSRRSQSNITPKQQLDLRLRGTGGFNRQNLIAPSPNASAYPTFTHVACHTTMDLRYAYRTNKVFEVTQTGRKLIGAKPLEYTSDYIPTVTAAISPIRSVSTRRNF